MRLRDWRVEPPPEPAATGRCAGCGEVILAGEEYLVFESGGRLHAHPDCKVHFVNRLLGIR